MSSAHTGSRTGSEVTRSEDHKSILFCPRCRHRSPVDGDWVHVVESGSIEVHCPDCWRHITSRPR